MIVEAGSDDPRITEAERRKEIALIEIGIDEKRAKLAELTDRNKSYFLMDQARVGQDARERLVSHWRSTQAWICKPCNPQGVDLKLSFPEEIEAYEKLEISKSILQKATKLPYPDRVS